MTVLKAYQTSFLELALEYQVLSFGEFTLKSGRVSPYFFNLGRIASGRGLRRLAQAYAEALLDQGIAFDMLFGPAYKGIPLVAAVACALAERGHDLPFAYNRKEAKDHGEGGVLVGAPVRGRVVIIDDVLTAGTAMRQSIDLLRASGAEPVLALTALDRQERGPGGLSATADLRRDTGVAVAALVTAAEVISFLQVKGSFSGTIDAMEAYQRTYGAISPAS